MPKFERSRERSSRGSRNESSRRDSRGSDREAGRYSRGSRNESSRRDSRGSGRYSRGSDRGYGREKPELQITKVICSSCKSECEVPFKPTSNKPVYCSDCFSQQGKGRSSSRSNSSSGRDLDIINKKLDKIMKALKIE